MSMSLFGSFDAFIAQTFGQKVSLSWSPALSKEEKKQGGVMMPAVVVSEAKAAADSSSSSSSSSPVDRFKKGKDGISSSSPPLRGKKPESQGRRRPRFAVELDGVHCFETIIPY